MTEIRHQVPGASEEIESAEIYIPDDSDVGSGEFTMVLNPDALPASKVFWQTIIHPPLLQVTATFAPNMNISVQLGYADPPAKKVFRIPASVAPEAKHNLRVNFSKWRLTDAFLDGERIEAVS